MQKNVLLQGDHKGLPYGWIANMVSKGAVLTINAHLAGMVACPLPDLQKPQALG